jgi:hypothetical protein
VASSLGFTMGGMAFLEVVGGAVLGFGFSQVGGWLARREEREHTRRERVRARQRGSVQGLDGALKDAHASLPLFTGPDSTGEAEVFKAHDHWQVGYFKDVSHVRDRELVDRYNAAGWVLLTCWLEASRGHGAETWYAIRAIANARRSCASFIMEEPLPEPTFPSRAEAKRMVRMNKKDGSYDWSALGDWLEKHPEE